MFVELIELLRCPRPHEEAQLVASASRTEARHIVEGLLGCPVCGAEFRIVNGVVVFDEPTKGIRSERASAETAMRLAAFLELTDARGFALLCGRWGAHADAILQLVDVKLVLVNPPPEMPSDVAAGVVVTRDAIPFAAGSARAVALDDDTSATFARSAVRAVRSGGRVVAPAALALPEGVTELVRDDRVWVGEKTAASDTTPRLVSIKKGTR